VVTSVPGGVLASPAFSSVEVGSTVLLGGSLLPPVADILVPGVLGELNLNPASILLLGSAVAGPGGGVQLPPVFLPSVGLMYSIPLQGLSISPAGTFAFTNNLSIGAGDWTDLCGKVVSATGTWYHDDTYDFHLHVEGGELGCSIYPVFLDFIHIDAFGTQSFVPGTTAVSYSPFSLNQVVDGWLKIPTGETVQIRVYSHQPASPSEAFLGVLWEQVGC
jgi:hypothetical protein